MYDFTNLGYILTIWTIHLPKGKHTEDLRIERKIHKSTKLVPTHTLTDQLIMKICRRVANQSRKIG